MSLDQPDDHLWSAASQLIEGVAFMHAQLIAHMDLKPDNIIILLRVVISPSLVLACLSACSGKKQKFCGIAGTTGYIAPEVEWGDAYKLIQADLWSWTPCSQLFCG
ncbi:hypothetical protein F5J12DRAFT_727466 [Pisolithus orientalis]|uniref:uncharacterized protein n=1 Tax=Pisolithus orientalis TaxID=936130 RepID=UPI00222509B7|nr:uncharacterized protein F5J12DRAFT_727466 [Pisolithus orientalis]KAI5991104.1 hypothetical protein F5J12DRAFT_727466 [Pisolithus orientalis]